MFRERPQVFLAISDPELRRVITEELETQGIDSVTPARDLASGTQWAEEIQRFIRQADAVIADLTGTHPQVLL